MIIFTNSQIYITLIVYLFFFLISIGGLVLFSVIIPNQESNGHGIHWIKEIPWLQKTIFFIIPVLIFSILTVSLAIPVGNLTVYLVKMKHDHFYIQELSVDSIDFKEQIYRSEVVGYHMVYSDGNERKESSTLFSELEMSSIQVESTITLYWGYIGNDIEIWKIKVVG